jgi:hypothetical protein
MAEEFPIAKNAYALLKIGIWLYFILLILEGALRKWFLPGLATPLLIVRDPLAIALILIALRNGVFPRNMFLNGVIFLGVLAIVTALFIGHGNLPVALYGARILLIHFPLIFIIGTVFTRKDVIKIGKIIVYISIPMTILIGLQYFSPQSAWVNLGVGGDPEGSGFNAGANGFYRPSGVFSFTIGVVHFYNLVTCFILYFWLKPEKIGRWILIIATISLIAAIPFSIARRLLFGSIVTLIFFLIALIVRPEYFKKIIPVGLVLLLAFLLLSTTTFFQTSIETFSKRIEYASSVQGGMEGVIGDRYLGGIFGALPKAIAEGTPFFGYGIGMGSNVGSMVLTGGVSYLIAEGEWGRVLGEMGVLMGMAFLLLRLGLCIRLTVFCFKKLLNSDFLPWLLLSFCLLIVPEGQWARPTTLGFAILIAGLTIASFKKTETKI